jgi:hypothetical protein
VRVTERHAFLEIGFAATAAPQLPVESLAHDFPDADAP